MTNDIDTIRAMNDAAHARRMADLAQYSNPIMPDTVRRVAPKPRTRYRRRRAIR